MTPHQKADDNLRAYHDLTISCVTGVTLERVMGWRCAVPPEHIEAVAALPPPSLLVARAIVAAGSLDALADRLYAEPAHLAAVILGREYPTHDEVSGMQDIAEEHEPPTPIERIATALEAIRYAVEP